MAKYRALALTTEYWKPKEDFMSQVVDALAKRVDNGDFVVVSEKALSIATGNIVDESRVSPGRNARFIAKVCMRVGWGYLLGVLCHFGKRLLRRLREYPLENGSRHKQLSLQNAGLLQALMFGSEGGIDGSNLPFSLVSLPLSGARERAEDIRGEIGRKLKKKVTVVIVDTDKTYSFRNFHFTPHPKPMNGIQSHGGVCAYVIGRMFRLKKRSTPLAVAGRELRAEEALKIANIADRVRGPGSGATVWDMAARFKVDVTGVTWDMLARTEHKPIVVVRRVG